MEFPLVLICTEKAGERERDGAKGGKQEREGRGVRAQNEGGGRGEGTGGSDSGRWGLMLRRQGRDRRETRRALCGSRYMRMWGQWATTPFRVLAAKEAFPSCFCESSQALHTVHLPNFGPGYKYS